MSELIDVLQLNNGRKGLSRSALMMTMAQSDLCKKLSFFSD